MRERNRPRMGVIVSIPVAIMVVFLPVTMVAVFTFTSIASWAEARRKEREAFYKSETLKKIAESGGAGGAAALDLMREQERIALRNRRDGQRLGGIITIAVAIGLMIFLRAVAPSEPAYLVGLIPLFVGIALLAHLATTKSKD
jgi:hypothetical protein